jgi:phage baseplate assembly protein V
MIDQDKSRMQQMIALFQRKLSNFIARGVLRLIGYQAGIQVLQSSFMNNETFSGMQHPQEFGFTSKANLGALTLALFNGGNRDHGQVLLVYDPSTLPTDLNSGDSCQYDTSDNRVWCKGSAGITIKNGNNTIVLNDAGVTITAPSGKFITLNGDTIIDGLLTVNGLTQINATLNVLDDIIAGGEISDLGTPSSSMAAMRTIYNEHTHNETDTVTEPPNQPME